MQNYPAVKNPLLLAAFALLFAGTVHAQDRQAAKPDDTVQKIEVTGAVDKYDARKNDTASKIVVSQEEILKFGDTTLAEVLKRQPGITIGGSRGGTEIRMRGLGNGYTQILLNGEAAPPGFAVDTLPPDLIERIEILRSASAEFSTQAIAGTINIILKKSVKVAQRELKLNAGGAGNFISSSANFQLSDKDGALSWSLGGNLNGGKFRTESYQTDEGVDAKGTPTLYRRGERLETGHWRNASLSPRLNWTFANGDTLTSQSFLNRNYFDREASNRWRATLGSLPVYAADDSQVIGTAWLARSDLNWVHKIAGGAKLDSKLGFNAAARNNDFHQQGYDSNNAMTLDSFTPGGSRERGMTLSGKLATPYMDDHTLGFGWDGGASQRDEFRRQNDRPIPGYVPVSSDERYSADLRRMAVFMQDEWNVTPSWSVYAGLRWEGLETRSRGSDFEAVRQRSSVLSPLFQTLWKFPNSKNDQIRFALTRTYKAPATDRLIPRRYTTINNSATTPDTQGNPALRPELAWGLDSAYEHFFADGALMSISGYLRRIDDFTRNAVSYNGARWIAMPVNDGRATTRGIELEAKFPLQLFYPAAPAIDVRANLTRNWSSVEQVPGPDNRLADQTPMSANLGLDYRMDAQFNLGGSFTYKSGGPIRVSQNQSTYATVKRELELYGLWKFDPKTQLRLSAVNLLAQDFTFIERYTDASASLRNTSVYPATALLRAALELKF
jgi:outer membrane receptor for ferrienterochelin and colicin